MLAWMREDARDGGSLESLLGGRAIFVAHPDELVGRLADRMARRMWAGCPSSSARIAARSGLSHARTCCGRVPCGSPKRATRFALRVPSRLGARETTTNETPADNGVRGPP